MKQKFALSFLCVLLILGATAQNGKRTGATTTETPATVTAAVSETGIVTESGTKGTVTPGDISNLPSFTICSSKRSTGLRRYELTDHLNNVRAVVTDKRLASATATSISDYSTDVSSWADYYAFGQALNGRLVNSPEYRHGYNSSEEEDEWKGASQHYTTFYRELDPRVGRWMSLDPKATAGESPYASMGNNPVLYNDPMGDTIKIKKGAYKRQEFLDAINKDSDVEFVFDSKDRLVPKQENAVGQSEYTKQLLDAVGQEQTVIFDLVSQDPGFLVDDVVTGKVDVDDMLAVDDQLFKASLLHFTAERFSVPNYEKVKHDKKSYWNDAHEAGFDAEIKYMKEQYPSLKIIEFGASLDMNVRPNFVNGTATIPAVSVQSFGDLKQQFDVQVTLTGNIQQYTASPIFIVTGGRIVETYK